MWILALAIVAAPPLVDEPGPTELARLLASADPVERAEAARTLEELGVDALPALRDAENSASGEARSRASALARTIEGRQLQLPRLVAIDFDSTPLDEAVRALADRSGHAIRLDAGKDAALSRRPIAARAPAPLPFWEALDRVGQAGHVRHDPTVRFQNVPEPPAIHLVDGEPLSWTLYRGAFRVHLVALHRRRDLDLGRVPGREPAPVGVLYVDAQAFVEPGRFLDPDGTPRIAAEDDRGRPVPARRRPGRPAVRAVGQPGSERGAPVAYPDGPARSGGQDAPPGLGDAPRDRLRPAARPDRHPAG